ncbi:hypothetical protein SDC9_20876 [bioreactor metagenome]|uniref:Helix-turn-helix domain-containing protein n=1 Tax=bioreactor metagenome TaxID=1076179 RepID=A0A644U7Z1_9ZZZZ
MHEFKHNLYTIREINQLSKTEQLSKAFQSYSCIYNLIKCGRVNATKIGNRYMLRIHDIEQALLVDSVVAVDGIRRIN